MTTQVNNRFYRDYYSKGPVGCIEDAKDTKYSQAQRQQFLKPLVLEKTDQAFKR